MVSFFTLSNGRHTAVVSDLGASLLQMHVPDRSGNLADVVLGRPDVARNSGDPAYMGVTVGRFAGRIRRGRFCLDGQEHHVTINEGLNHIHGGARGFDKHIWSASVHSGEEAVTFSRVSPDGEEGYPGQVDAAVTYRLVDATLEIEMSATCDRPTPVSMINHSYWNLAGHDSGDMLGHELQVLGSQYLPMDDELIPTGEIVPVRGTALDFLTPRGIGERMSDLGTGGYDHLWALDGSGSRIVARLTDPRSGRRFELESNQAGACIYAGRILEGLTAKSGARAYSAFAGLALETQGLPGDVDACPSVLRPGDRYVNTMRFTFSAV